MSNSPVRNIGIAFIDAYYRSLDNKIPSLSEMYSDDSEASVEGQSLQGKNDIIARLSGIAKKITRTVISNDVISVNATDIIVLVTGYLALDDDPFVRYSEFFYLKQSGTGSGYPISRQIFRLHTE